MNKKKSDLFNIIWYIVGSLSYGFTSLIYMIIINRLLNVEATGQYSFAFAIASIFYTIGVYYGMTYQVTDVSNKYSDTDYIYNRLTTCFIMFFLSLIFVFFNKYSESKILLVLLLVCYRGFDALFDALHAIIQKRDSIYKIGLMVFLRTILLIIIFFTMTLIFRKLFISVVSIVLLDLLFTIFVELPVIKKIIVSSKFNFRKNIKLLCEGFFVFAFTFLAMFILNSPKYVIDVYLNDELQGIFGIVFMPSSFMSMVSIYFIHPFLNEITECIKCDNYKGLSKIIFKLSIIILIFGFIVSFVSFLIGIPVLELMYGINLSNYRIDLLIIMIGTIWYSLYSLLSSIFIAMRRNIYQVIILILISIFSYFLCNILISRYSILGASFSYFIIMFVQLVIYVISYFVIFFKKKCR
jgi:O-antigen/teichoic acid export membrane protein